ncbi:hypothetical protein HDK90DRAFT_514378 [Phyllosticta capitalensis]|uniref:Uncharacterized protein n=1 Tax=Phyllosticta capitalensis TaxID=121624 RepID=A0ABR1YCN4_9PEZI
MATFKSLATKARKKFKRFSRHTDSDSRQESPKTLRSHAIRMLVDHELQQIQETNVAGEIHTFTSRGDPQHAESKMSPELTTSGFPKPDLTNHGPHPADVASPRESREWSWYPLPKSSQNLMSDDRDSLNPYLETASFVDVGTTIDPQRPSREYGRARFGYDFLFSDSTGEGDLFTEDNYIQAFFEEAATARMSILQTTPKYEK